MDNKTTSEEQLEQIKEAFEKKALDPGQVARSLRIAPSKRQILQLPKDLLLKHNALIFHKGSTLSSTQRRMVQERVAYGINKGTIKPEEVAQEINKLNALIQGELVKAIEEKKDDSSIDESKESGE
jgi:hypothetical protein